jgi:erythronate-4-phosphate dehydrogenase
LAPFGAVEVLPANAITRETLRGADALVCRSTVKVNADLLADTGVKFVGTCTIGFDHVDLDYLAAQKIAFASAPGCNANSVGEYLTAALLAYAIDTISPLRDKTIGIVGVGNVGKSVAQKARALGMRVLLNDPPRERAEGADGFTALNDLLRESDFVTLHVPLTRGGADATVGLANADFFSSMKNGAVFINASRGKVVDEDALLRALDDKKIGAAILDVFATEPKPRLDLLRKLFLATPHIAGYSYNGKVNGLTMVREKLSECFGAAAPWDPTPFLPEPEIGRIDIESDATFEVELHDIVSAIYDIQRDSDALKAAPRDFARFREEYRERLEFPYTVIAPPRGRRDLIDACAGLGFQVE